MGPLAPTVGQLNEERAMYGASATLSMSPVLGSPIPAATFAGLTKEQVVHLERKLSDAVDKLTRMGEDMLKKPVPMGPTRTDVTVDFAVTDESTGAEWAGMQLRYPNLDRNAVDMIWGVVTGQLASVDPSTKGKRKK